MNELFKLSCAPDQAGLIEYDRRCKYAKVEISHGLDYDLPH